MRKAIDKLFQRPFYLVVGIIVIMVLIQYFTKDTPSPRDNTGYPDTTRINVNDDIYDYEHDRMLTKEMRDTMIYSGGHWYNRSNPPKSKPAPKVKLPKSPEIDEQEIQEIMDKNTN